LLEGCAYCMTPRKSPHWSAMAGEFFVASECFRLEWECAVTYGNAKGIDMMLVDSPSGKMATIDVKSIRGGHPWFINKSRVKVEKNHFYVLVNYRNRFSDNINTRPECYIIPSSDIIGMIVPSGRGSQECVDYRTVRGSKYYEAWNLIFPSGTSPTVPLPSPTARKCGNCGRTGHNRRTCPLP